MPYAPLQSVPGRPSRLSRLSPSFFLSNGEKIRKSPENLASRLAEIEMRGTLKPVTTDRAVSRVKAHGETERKNDEIICKTLKV